MVNVPSPAVAIVGRHNSGKTTLIERVISELVLRGYDVGSVKHHSHVGFQFDLPGKDSYRHRQAGSRETVIAAPGQLARVKTIAGELECADIVRSMPGHDIVIVEGYRKSGLPTIEVMRSGNPADMRVAQAFALGASRGWELGVDFTQASRTLFADGVFCALPSNKDITAASEAPDDKEALVAQVAHDALDPSGDVAQKMPAANTVAIITDIPCAIEAAGIYDIPALPIDDTAALADFLEVHFVRPRVTVVIQAGGESKRMGTSKATVPFAGHPLMCRLVERLSPVADELIITTNEPENLVFLQQDFPDVHIRLVRDKLERRGALPGLYTALVAANNPFVAVVACDMVFASASLVVAEALEMKRSDADVVVPVNKHGFEPFHAIYRRESCLPAIRRALDAGESRAQAFFEDDAVVVEEFSQRKVLEAEPMGGCFLNANTPDELAAFERLALDN